MNDHYFYITSILPLTAGWILDLIFGDPARLPHPVVGFGKIISFLEHRFNHGSHRLLTGAITSVLLVTLTFILTVLVLFCAYSVNSWLGIAVEGVGIFYCLAGKTLRKEVKGVFVACRKGIEQGRKQVARIVGRDTAALTEQEVKTAALETLAENLSDGVVAPLFWYAILGLPGMMMYKMINTLDSMTGYRNDRYLLYGRFAARMDDAANFIPARLTAAFMAFSSGKLQLFRFIHKYGRQHASPNSGYPESALAGILNCRFGGTHDYFGQSVYKPYIGENDRQLTAADCILSNKISLRTEVICILFALLVHVAIGLLLIRTIL